QIELAYRMWRLGSQIAQVPITFTDRVRGNSKMSLGIAFEELVLVTWWGFRDRVLRRGRS
ncbi:MAG TPA: dolichol-phosphate mannosyltransferase, partial [Acidimicrobiia bacterium]|nr:dolichol-phosphate mannosyltransferase [Acidimicrobiia bacterium]